MAAGRNVATTSLCRAKRAGDLLGDVGVLGHVGARLFAALRDPTGKEATLAAAAAVAAVSADLKEIAEVKLATVASSIQREIRHWLET